MSALGLGQLVSLNSLCAGRHRKVPLRTKEERQPGLFWQERELFMVCYKSAATG